MLNNVYTINVLETMIINVCENSRSTCKWLKCSNLVSYRTTGAPKEVIVLNIGSAKTTYGTPISKRKLSYPVGLLLNRCFLNIVLRIVGDSAQPRKYYKYHTFFNKSGIENIFWTRISEFFTVDRWDWYHDINWNLQHVIQLL